MLAGSSLVQHVEAAVNAHEPLSHELIGEHATHFAVGFTVCLSPLSPFSISVKMDLIILLQPAAYQQEIWDRRVGNHLLGNVLNP